MGGRNGCGGSYSQRRYFEYAYQLVGKESAWLCVISRLRLFNVFREWSGEWSFRRALHGAFVVHALLPLNFDGLNGGGGCRQYPTTSRDAFNVHASGSGGQARGTFLCAFTHSNFPEQGAESRVFGGSPPSSAVLLVFMSAGREG